MKSRFIAGGREPYIAASCWNKLEEAHLWVTPASGLRKNYSFLCFIPILANFWQQNRQHFVMTNRAVATQASRNPITSREWYWNQARSWEAGRRCLAPLWRMTNSIQKTARSRGFIGWSWWILDNFIAFSLYLQGKYKNSNMERNLICLSISSPWKVFEKCLMNDSK